MDILSALLAMQQPQQGSNPLAALQGLQLGQDQQSQLGAGPINSPQPFQQGFNSLLAQLNGPIDSNENYWQMNSPPSQGQMPNMGGPQLPVQSNNNTASIIKQQLGAIDQQQPDTVSNILSGRFQDLPQGTQYGDYAQGVVQSALGKPVLGTEIGQQRSTNMMSTLSNLQRLDAENRRLDFMLSGNQRPAAIQIADEMQKARASGDTQRYNDLALSQKVYDKGVVADASGNAVPINNYGNAVAGIAATKKGAEEQAGTYGKQIGDAKANLNAAEASMPQLEDVVNKLSVLGKTATYTQSGIAANNMRRQLGLPVGQGAITREEYINYANDNVLPLLRRTFGSQFTEAEGIRLMATLGDPNKSPPEKDASLSAFIDSKRQSLETMRREANPGQSIAPSGQPDLSDPGFQAFLKSKGVQ